MKRNNVLEIDKLERMEENDFMFIFKRESIINEFRRINPSIIGLDAYFKGLFSKYPIYVFSFVNDALRGVPLFICILDENNEKKVTKMISVVKNYLKLPQNFRVMIDNDSIFKNSLQKNNLYYFLCKFHLIKRLY